MTIETIVGISRQTVELVLALAGPVLLAGLVVGLAVALFQAATQINEMTLTLIPKMVAVVVSLALFGPWMLQKLVSFTKEHKMPWAQVYDGKFWEAAIAQKYGVDSIPRAYLVDGDTGEIVAAGQSLRGTQLEATIQKALAGRAKP